ncbi:SPOR domain-containing protein [Niveibacterium umoris]|uniref:DedD protein n=1 Tax=Niveibacterium umoris TaxID=1193620 RepID=A0A840BG02_9RHOO|nr:SPOR domain-containing protein [Niveibacterium umoris]MBB4012105.1 DedD protein [Niveibacterium umoris]
MFAAIVLPLVMEHEPKQTGQDIQIRIPSQEGANFASRVIQGAAPTPPKPSVPVEDEKPSGVVALPSPSEGVTSSAPAPKAPEPAAKSEEAGARKGVEASTEKAEKAASKGAATVDAGKARHDEEERAAAILSGHKTAAVESSGGFVVQLGAFKDAANIASVKSKVKDLGYSAYTEPLADKTRVRAGPFQTREAAEAAAGKLRKAGLSAVVAAR